MSHTHDAWAKGTNAAQATDELTALKTQDEDKNDAHILFKDVAERNPKNRKLPPISRKTVGFQLHPELEGADSKKSPSFLLEKRSSTQAATVTKNIVGGLMSQDFRKHREVAISKLNAKPDSTRFSPMLQDLQNSELFSDFLGEGSFIHDNSKQSSTNLMAEVFDAEFDELEVRTGVKFARLAHRILYSQYWSALSGILTVMSLYIPDLQHRCFPKDTDVYNLDGILTFIFIFFIVDLLANSYSRYDYTFSFFFWLDIVGIISLIPDVPWMVGLLGMNGGSMSVAKGGRAGKAAKGLGSAKFMTKVLRMVKMTKLSRVVKMVFLATHDNQLENPANTEVSKIGAILADKTSKKVIVGVLFMFVIVPLLAVSAWNPSAFVDEMRLVNYVYDNHDFATFNSSVSTLIGLRSNMLYFRYDGETFLDSDLSHLRELEVYEESKDKWHAKFDIREASHEEAELNMILTTVVVLLFAIGSTAFSHDATRMVVEPLERTLKIITDLARSTFWLAAQDNDWTIEQCSSLEEELVKSILVKIGVIFNTVPNNYGAQLKKMFAPNMALIHEGLIQAAGEYSSRFINSTADKSKKLIPLLVNPPALQPKVLGKDYEDDALLRSATQHLDVPVT